MKKHAIRNALVVTMLLGLMTISANAAECTYENPHAIGSTDHSGWTEITAATTELTDGNFYLAGDVLTENGITVNGKVTLCLNGKTLDLANDTLKATGEKRQQLFLSAGAELHVCDCHAADAAGKITSSATKYVSLINTDQTGCQVHLWNGSLADVAGGNAGGAVKFGHSTTDMKTGNDNLLHIHGGKITNITENNGTAGSAIFFTSNDTMLMCDGEISNNTAKKCHGGALHARGTGNTIIINGGTISENKVASASKSGGALYFYEADTTVTIGGDAKFLNNKIADDTAGFIYFRNNATGTLTIKDEATFIGTSLRVGGMTPNITGGIFEEDVTEFIDDSAYTLKFVDGYYKVVSNSETADPATPADPAPTPADNFSDVSADAWYYTAVNYVLNNNLMSGYNETTFGPDDNLSRAMVVQVLYNKEGKPAVTAENKFPDVKADDWFFNATCWGADKGVVSGYGDGRFGPNDNVTIEQVAVILYNYSGKPEASGTVANAGQYSDWAANALSWAEANGLLKDVPFTNATETATRAQTAQMLMNLGK